MVNIWNKKDTLPVGWGKTGGMVPGGTAGGQLGNIGGGKGKFTLRSPKEVFKVIKQCIKNLRGIT